MYVPKNREKSNDLKKQKWWKKSNERKFPLKWVYLITSTRVANSIVGKFDLRANFNAIGFKM